MFSVTLAVPINYYRHFPIAAKRLPCLLSVRTGNLALMPRLAQFDLAAVTATLRNQQGIITRSQARAQDMTEMVIRYRTRPDGPWQVVLPGVYLDRGGHLTAAQRATAAYLYSGHAIAVTGAAAIAWHGVPVQAGAFVDVLVPLRHRRCDAGFVRLRRTSIPPRATYRDGVVAYACVDRAIVDAARQMTDLADVRAVIAAGVQRGKVHVQQLADELDRGPAAGSARLRMAIAEVAEGVRSAAEADLRKIIVASRLPTPLYNARLYVGKEFLASPDAWWPDAGVAAEVESKAWLRSAKREIVSEIKSALAASRGPLPHIVTQRAA